MNVTYRHVVYRVTTAAEIRELVALAARWTDVHPRSKDHANG